MATMCAPTCLPVSHDRPETRRKSLKHSSEPVTRPRVDTDNCGMGSLARVVLHRPQLCVIAAALVWFSVRDYESFTPPVSTAVDRVDCLARDIAATLLLPSDAIAPSLFAAREAVTHQTMSAQGGSSMRTWQTSSGEVAIDSVCIEEGIESVDEAFREQSRQSLPISRPTVCKRLSSPAGLWLVDETGSDSSDIADQTF